MFDYKYTVFPRCREKDLSEVLQSETVYLNVSKAQLAKSTDLEKAFGTTDQSKICLEVGSVLFIIFMYCTTYNLHFIAITLGKDSVLVCFAFSLLGKIEPFENLFMR